MGAWERVGVGVGVGVGGKGHQSIRVKWGGRVKGVTHTKPKTGCAGNGIRSPRPSTHPALAAPTHPHSPQSDFTSIKHTGTGNEKGHSHGHKGGGREWWRDGQSA